MNKSLRQLFTIVVALFVILGMSTTIITVSYTHLTLPTILLV